MRCNASRFTMPGSSGLSSDGTNHTGVLLGLVSSHSENEMIGTRQRYVEASHRRQYGPQVFRMFVTGVAAVLHEARHAPAHHRGPALAILDQRTIGAMVSGQMADRKGKFPVRSWSVPVSSRMARGLLAIG
jgi:hypothetical protein